MSPEENYSYPPSLPDDNQFKKRLRLLLVLAIVLVVVIAAFAILNPHKKPGATTRTTTFSITGIVPGIGGITTQTSSMGINFNMPLKTNSATVTSSPSIITATNITGNMLTLTFVTKTLVSTKHYDITINSISSTTGKRITKQLISFTPSFAGPATSGGDALINIGLSTDQVNSLFADVSQFNPWAQNVVIDQSTIKHYLENPSDAWSPWAVSFSMNVDGTNYNVVGDFNNTESIQVNIYDPATNQQLFTTGSPGSF